MIREWAIGSYKGLWGHKRNGQNQNIVRIKGIEEKNILFSARPKTWVFQKISPFLNICIAVVLYMFWSSVLLWR